MSPIPLIAFALIASVLDLILWLRLPHILARRGIILVPRTMFGPAVVFDSTDGDGVAIRLLNVRNKFQSVSYIDPDLRWDLVCVYHRYFAEITDIMGERGGVACRSAAIIGGGAYSFPKWLIAHCPDVSVTVIEIDPAITRIAREYFFLNDLISEFDAVERGRLELICDDGWKWLQDCARKFDLIVNDAFAGKKPLGALTGEEGARLVYVHLSSSGVYLANIIASLKGRGTRPLAQTSEAFAREFHHVWLIPEAADEPKRLGNNVLIASDRPLHIASRYSL